MAKIVRVGVTFPPELLNDFDKVIEDMGYKSRSKAIHDAVRAFVNEQKWLSNVEGDKVGSITMIYNHQIRKLEADLTEVQHHFESIISASMHMHISQDRCLEAIAVKGTVEKIKHLAAKLRARRGVEEVRLNIFFI
ncbi:MAG: nickel-responsive transcriptional regulator NikR [Candidatus Bathyarchaeota archaeon]|nr:MAG: nickel-responsive transcriptional regulator NikR [Candidatus Bathyarchaeota archaeon]